MAGLLDYLSGQPVAASGGAGYAPAAVPSVPSGGVAPFMPQQSTGLLDLLFGNSNPLSQFVDTHGALFGALGAGLARGPDFAAGLANAAQLVPQARAADQQLARDQYSRTATYQFLKSNPDTAFLADAIQAGADPSTVYSAGLKIMADKKAQQTDLQKAQSFADQLEKLPGANAYADLIAGLRSGAIDAASGFKDYLASKQNAAKPPTVTTMYNGQGAEQKMIWDPSSQSYKPFGGPKAAAGDPNQDANIKAIGDAIINGTQPPSMTGLYHLAGPLKAYLANQGYDLTKATQDWSTTQRLLSTMGGPQQTRIRQATQQVADQLDLVKGLAAQWQAGGFKPLNAVTRKAAEQGLLGPKAQSIVTRLDSAIADMTAELGTVYMGGNTPTDHALDLAARNLNADWADTTLNDNIEQIGKNLQIRLNSLNLSTPGFPDSAYNPMTPNGGYAPVPNNIPSPSAAPQAPADGPTATNPTTGQRIVLRNGQWVPLGQ